MIRDLFKIPILEASLNVDLKTLKKHCLKIKKSYLSSYLSNTGYQSPPLMLDCNFQPLFESIRQPLSEFYHLLDIPKELTLSNFWVNINHHRDYNKRHDHPRSLISGVFYVDVPNNSGDIIFINPTKYFLYSGALTSIQNKNFYNNSWAAITPTNNQLLLFPSYLEHEVAANESKKDRISISFNFDMVYSIPTHKEI